MYLRYCIRETDDHGAEHGDEKTKEGRKENRRDWQERKYAQEDDEWRIDAHREAHSTREYHHQDDH